MTSASYKKDIILNEAQILQDAWSRYIANYSKGWSFESAYSHVKADARNKLSLNYGKDKQKQKEKLRSKMKKQD